MDVKTLTQLIGRPESATLEFKRKPYLVDSNDSEIRRRQRDELVKDILALANGNAIVAGETAYLVIGVDDKFNELGQRLLFDAKEHGLNTQRILNLVNSACEPSVQDLTCEEIKIGNTILLVITIFPSPYLHETTRELRTSSGVYSPHVVFVRHNENVHIASRKEQDTIAQIKKYRFDERRNPPATIFGLIVGTMSGSVLSYSIAKSDLEEHDPVTISAAGAFTGGVIGFSIGSLYRNFYEIRSDWNTIPKNMRMPLVLGSFIAGLGVTKLLGILFHRRNA